MLLPTSEKDGKEKQTLVGVPRGAAGEEGDHGGKLVPVVMSETVLVYQFGRKIEGKEFQLD